MGRTVMRRPMWTPTTLPPKARRAQPRTRHQRMQRSKQMGLMRNPTALPAEPRCLPGDARHFPKLDTRPPAVHLTVAMHTFGDENSVCVLTYRPAPGPGTGTGAGGCVRCGPL